MCQSRPVSKPMPRWHEKHRRCIGVASVRNKGAEAGIFRERLRLCGNHDPCGRTGRRKDRVGRAPDHSVLLKTVGKPQGLQHVKRFV